MREEIALFVVAATLDRQIGKHSVSAALQDAAQSVRQHGILAHGSREDSAVEAE